MLSVCRGRLAEPSTEGLLRGAGEQGDDGFGEIGVAGEPRPFGPPGVLFQIWKD